MKYCIVSLLVWVIGLSSPLACASSIVTGEDGYRLWQKYDLLQDKKSLNQYKKQLVKWHVSGQSKTSQIIRDELDYALSGLLGQSESTSHKAANLVVTTARQAKIWLPGIADDLKKLGNEGYLIRQIKHQNKSVMLIAANTDIGALYGTFNLLRLVQTQTPLNSIDIVSAPKTKVRVLNHWDNPDRHVERGFAGESIWDWHKLPEYKYQKYTDYARANASIGINGTVLNNVNADPIMLTPAYLEKVKALADLFRPYGLKVYLSIKFNSPATLGGLKNSDPLNPDVQQWWQQ